MSEKETKTNNEDVANNASSPLGDLISSPLFYVTFGIVGGVAIVQYFENAALLLSAFPIVGLTLLSKTDFGTELEEAILEQRPALEAAAAEVRERERERERPFTCADITHTQTDHDVRITPPALMHLSLQTSSPPPSPSSPSPPSPPPPSETVRDNRVHRTHNTCATTTRQASPDG